jgi:hypothetical protein
MAPPTLSFVGQYGTTVIPTPRCLTRRTNRMSTCCQREVISSVVHFHSTLGLVVIFVHGPNSGFQVSGIKSMSLTSKPALVSCVCCELQKSSRASLLIFKAFLGFPMLTLITESLPARSRSTSSCSWSSLAGYGGADQKFRAGANEAKCFETRLG